MATATKRVTLNYTAPDKQDAPAKDRFDLYGPRRRSEPSDAELKLLYKIVEGTDQWLDELESINGAAGALLRDTGLLSVRSVFVSRVDETLRLTVTFEPLADALARDEAVDA